MTDVSLHGISKAFDGTPAVQGIDLHIASGEMCALLGPSGCGKTTLLRLIAGLDVPGAGRICFGARDMAGVDPRDRNAGLVFQSYALFPHMTVAQNVGFGLSVRGLPPAEQAARVDEMLATVQLDGLRDRFPAQLSGGQRQRVALARTLVTEPDVLMLDEPLANLDTGLRAEMRSFIRDLQRRLGITTVFVTHDQTEALQMADRVAVVLDGRIAQEGPPEAVYRRPATAEVARFMGVETLLAARVSDGTADGPLGPIPVPLGTPEGEALLALRAEALCLGETGVPGTILSRDFAGAQARYRVAVGDAQIVVTQQARELLDPGASVRVSVAPDDVWVIPR